MKLALVVLSISCGSALAPSVTHADECSTIEANPPIFGSADHFIVDPGNMPLDQVLDAEHYWTSEFPGAGIKFPDFINSQSPANGPGSCGDTSFGFYDSSHKLAVAIIELFAAQKNGLPCNPVDSLAHELGHVYGLGDAPPGQDCAGRIMGQSVFVNGAAQPRFIGTSDCQVADHNWITSVEVSPNLTPNQQQPANPGKVGSPILTPSS